MATERKVPYALSLSLVLDPAMLPEFYPFLQQGFLAVVQTGCSVRELLCYQFGIPDEYVRGRITTIFQNGRAIDDLDGAIVRDGSRLTLSAAMPGLVGATMRRGGYYAAMRGSITHRETGEAGQPGEGTIRMKLFNLLMAELGPIFLLRGIGVAASDLADFLARRPASFRKGCRRIQLNGAPLSPERLGEKDMFAGRETVWLTIACAGRS
jgi:hypothetical protein